MFIIANETALGMANDHRGLQNRRSALKKLGSAVGAGILGTAAIPQTAAAVDNNEKIASEVNTWYSQQIWTNSDDGRQQMMSQNTNIMWHGVLDSQGGRDVHRFTVQGHGATRRRYANEGNWGEWGTHLADKLRSIGFELNLTGSVGSAEIAFDHPVHDGSIAAAGIPQAKATGVGDFLAQQAVIMLASKGVGKLLPASVTDDLFKLVGPVGVSPYDVAKFIGKRFFPDYKGSYQPTYTGQYVTNEWTINNVDGWLDLITGNNRADDLEILLDFVVDVPAGTDIDDVGLEARTYVDGGRREAVNNQGTGDHDAAKVFNTITSDEIPIGMK